MTHYLQEQGLTLPLALDAPQVGRYVADRIVGLGASRTRFVRAAVRIFLDADGRDTVVAASGGRSSRCHRG